MALTDEQISYYEEKALDLEHDLINVNGYDWNVNFNHSWFMANTEIFGFDVSKDDIFFSIEVNGKIHIDYDETYFDVYEDSEPFSPDELILLGTFAKKLKNNNL